MDSQKNRIIQDHTCRVKRSYETKVKAEIAARQHNILMDVYQCDVCKKFHLTKDRQYLKILRREGKQAAEKYRQDKNHKKLYSSKNKERKT